MSVLFSVQTVLGHTARLEKGAYYGHIALTKQGAVRPSMAQIRASLVAPALIRQSAKAANAFWYSKPTGGKDSQGQPWHTMTVLTLDAPLSGYVSTSMNSVFLGNKGLQVWP